MPTITCAETSSTTYYTPALALAQTQRFWCRPNEWFEQNGNYVRDALRGGIPGGWRYEGTVHNLPAEDMKRFEEMYPGVTINTPDFCNPAMVGQPVDRKWVYRPEWLIDYDPNNIPPAPEATPAPELSLTDKLKKLAKQQRNRIQELQSLVSQFAFTSPTSPDQLLLLIRLLAPVGKSAHVFSDGHRGRQVKVVGPDCSGSFEYVGCTLPIVDVLPTACLVYTLNTPRSDVPGDRVFFFGSLELLPE